MVPFWRRRLLMVTLPAGLACAWCWVLAASQTAANRSPLSSIAPLRYRASADVSVAASFLLFFMPLLIAIVLLARPTRRHRLGLAGSLSVSLVALFIFVWLQAALRTTATGLGGMLTGSIDRGTIQIIALDAVALTLLVVLWRAIRRRPREHAVAALGRDTAWLGLAGCAALIPFAATDLHNTPASLAQQWFNTTPMQWNAQLVWYAAVCFLHLTLGGAALAFFGRQLAIRHTDHHARHCHSCGYELTGVEAYSCPECDHRIGRAQAEHRAQLTANGSQSTSSSPTAST